MYFVYLQYIFKVMKKVNSFIRNKFLSSLPKEDLVKYKNILKLIHNKDSKIYPHKRGEYYIYVESLDTYLIIEKSNSELVNNRRSSQLQLSDEVYDRLIIRIEEELVKRKKIFQDNLKIKKQEILEKSFNNMNK